MAYEWKARNEAERAAMVAVFGMLETTTAGKQLSAVGRELLALGLYKSRAFDERKAATDYARRLLDKMAEQHPRVACRWKNIGTASARVYFLRD